jgi:hypothetical protein
LDERRLTGNPGDHLLPQDSLIELGIPDGNLLNLGPVAKIILTGGAKRIRFINNLPLIGLK